MGLALEVVLALRDIQRRKPELLSGLERHGIVIDDRIASSCQPQLAARIRRRLEGVQSPTCLRGLKQIEYILRQEMQNLEGNTGSGLADGLEPPQAPQTAAVASAPMRVPPASIVKEQTPAAIPPAPVEWQERPPQVPWLPPDLKDPLHSVLDDFKYENDREVCVSALPGWRVLAGTRRGRLHAHHGRFREDAFAHDGDQARGQFWIFCVCDGAGSSRLSRIGSEVTGRRLVRELSRVFHERLDEWATLPTAGLQEMLEKAIVEGVRETVIFLCGLAKKANVEPKEFRSTLLLTVLYCHNDTELACLSQVGDGFLAGLNRQGIAKRYGTADASGGFSGEVNCFIPDDGSAEKAKPFGIIPSTENLEALLLCTDGIEDPFYPVEANAELLFQQFTHETPTATPVAGIRWPEDPGGLVACADRTLACQRLARWLAFEKKGENDDRTVMLIQREPASGGAGSPKSPNA